jgi:DNA modification methylase
MSDESEKHKYKLTKELLDELRSIEGFPIGKDEDIVALSDPPHYTACPNPWIAEFIKEHGIPYNPKSDSYIREPFAADVSEGKNDPIYNAHGYHTKVPHKAIMRYILHYTEPGDIIFDGFCGSGMTGVAAQICANPDPTTKEMFEIEMPDLKWGARKAILNDLSPAATFIAYNYNTPVDASEFEHEAKMVLSKVEQECRWMYETQHVVEGKPVYKQDVDNFRSPVKGEINYTVWSDVFICPSCSRELIFWDVAIDKKQGEILNEFNCPHCHVQLAKRNLERAINTIFDETLQTTIQSMKQIPVLINYSIIDKKGNSKRFEKTPDDEDIALIREIEKIKIPYWYPTNPMMFKGAEWGDTWRAGIHTGITHVHHFYYKRSLFVLSKIFNVLSDSSLKTTPYLWFIYEQAIIGMSLLNRYGPTHYSQVNRNLSGTLYVGSQISEVSPAYFFKGKIRRISSLLKTLKRIQHSSIISCQSSSVISNMRSNSIDYIFVDPPFGGNLMYSELNFLLESWLKVFTNNKEEALINSVQRKGLTEYQHIMEECFKEFYRILKPGRWMTVEFHNSQNSVWISIQEAFTRAGFVVADVRTLDKQQGTFKQVTTTSAVKQDLIISAYKPNGGLEERFKLTAGKPEAVWDFVRQHLKHLPVFSEKNGVLQTIVDRQPYLLFDRMVAFHVQRGVIVPISAGDFYAGLRQRFPERDGMYFLEDQVTEYDRKRMTIKKVDQEVLFVCDEKSSVRWLRKELLENPDTLQNLRPKFMKELHQYT